MYRHEYEGVDEAFIWNTVKNGLEPLKKVVEAELRSEGK
jgi:uncharacterized protein with HEPN domain